MRVQELQLSNILSFKYEANISNAFKITFDPTLNIIIGGNGSGKSTVLEALNFIFRRVLFKHYKFNQNYFNDARLQQKKNTFSVDEQANRISNFRLQPNWQTESSQQTIKGTLVLDDIDKLNIENIVNNYNFIKAILEKYSNKELPSFTTIAGGEVVSLAVAFSGSDDTYEVTYEGGAESIVFYLENYTLINEAITLHNKTGTSNIDLLGNTFAMLSAFRNYTNFLLNTSLSSDPREQIRNIRGNNSHLSNNDYGGEPSIFNVVKLRLGEVHFNSMHGSDTVDSAVDKANSLELVKKINNKLKILDLKFSIGVTDTHNWSYEFKFHDAKHNRDMGNVNNLSAGQKSIIHLIFEAYGQDDMKGGVVIIDEPEIHLHYQFQYEYLRILEELATEQKTQYIIVTHSDGFISSSTASYVKRLSLNSYRYSAVYAPTLSTEQKKLVEILDNTQSARALFSDKVALVEGPGDEYFFRSVLKSHIPELRQEIAIYSTGGKDNTSWKNFFEAFGVIVYQIKDLDATASDLYSEANVSLKTEQDINSFKTNHVDIITKIDAEYANNCFYLKSGALEQYTKKPKKMENVIKFCETMDTFLVDGSDKSKEVINIMDSMAN